jgi:bla regulator protein blaR1
MMANELTSIWDAVAPALGNHLWQSTVCLAVAGLLTLRFRKNSARTRYALWLAASLKFLVPFFILISVGSYIAGPRLITQTRKEVYVVMEQVSRPFHQPMMMVLPTAAASTPAPSSIHALAPALAGFWFAGFAAVIFCWLVRLRRISAAVRSATVMREGREVEALRRVESRGGIPKRIPILLSSGSIEPGIFGILRPVLLWPKGISGQLEDAHLEAIVAHEVCHVRRRDNLAAAAHMLVEAVFWFHPLVWWLGARLVEERERACDEEVLESGSARKAYAEGILKTCRFCVGSPLACVSGVTGGELKKRIVRIMTGRSAAKLDWGRKMLLAAIGMAAVAGPVGYGLVNPPQIRWKFIQTIDRLQYATGLGAQRTLPKNGPQLSFEVASIKLDQSRRPLPGYHLLGDRVNATLPAEQMIAVAYNLNGSINGNQISGGPGWIKSDMYDVDAKVEDSRVQGEWKKLSFSERWDQVRLMLQSLLADRFKLKLSHETKDLPVYSLVVDKKGPKVAQVNASPECVGGIGSMGPGKFRVDSCDLGSFAKLLSMSPEVGGRLVLDKTGLRGTYSFTFQWTPEYLGGRAGAPADNAPSPESSGPGLFTALREQLGLRLESTKAPVDTLVIEHIERPSPD